MSIGQNRKGVGGRRQGCEARVDGKSQVSLAKIKQFNNHSGEVCNGGGLQDRGKGFLVSFSIVGCYNIWNCLVYSNKCFLLLKLYT